MQNLLPHRPSNPPLLQRPLARVQRALLAALLLLVVPISLPQASSSPVAALATGQLLLPRTSGLAIFDLSTGAEQPLYTTREIVLGAAWSPDGARVAFAQFGRDPRGSYGADLFIYDGGQVSLAVPRAVPDQLLVSPTWTPDGQSLIYGSTSATGDYSIERASLDGSQRTVLDTDALSPNLAPDGTLLVYARASVAYSLVVRPLAGGAARELLPAHLFSSVSSPRLSPDGRRVAFAAIGGPAGARQPRQRDLLSALSLGPAVVRAHGIPWDPWVINVDGSGLRQLATLAADDPAFAWSPDGSSLAVLGGDALWLLPLDGSTEPTQLTHGSYGSPDWRP